MNYPPDIKKNDKNAQKIYDEITITLQQDLATRGWYYLTNVGNFELSKELYSEIYVKHTEKVERMMLEYTAKVSSLVWHRMMKERFDLGIPYFRTNRLLDKGLYKACLAGYHITAEKVAYDMMGYMAIKSIDHEVRKAEALSALEDSEERKNYVYIYPLQLLGRIARGDVDFLEFIEEDHFWGHYDRDGNLTDEINRDQCYRAVLLIYYLLELPPLMYYRRGD